MGDVFGAFDGAGIVLPLTLMVVYAAVVSYYLMLKSGSRSGCNI